MHSAKSRHHILIKRLLGRRGSAGRSPPRRSTLTEGQGFLVCWRTAFVRRGRTVEGPGASTREARELHGSSTINCAFHSPFRDKIATDTYRVRSIVRVMIDEISDSAAHKSEEEEGERRPNCQKTSGNPDVMSVAEPLKECFSRMRRSLGAGWTVARTRGLALQTKIPAKNATQPASRWIDQPMMKPPAYWATDARYAENERIDQRAGH